MACKGTKVSQKEIERMVELYEQLGTFKAVAKRMRRSPSTVAKYLGQVLVANQVAHYYKNLIIIKERSV